MKTIAIFGYGYTAKFLVKEFLKDNNVIVVTRHPENVTEKNVVIIRFGDSLPEIDGVISTVPPCNEIDPVLEKYSPTCWAAYCSSTSVYGDHQGDWVTEQSPCNPTNEKSKNRLKIEQQWMKLPNPCILRLAGIYGPDRSVFEQLKSPQAKRIDKPNHVFSRIHVQDIAGFSHFAFSEKLTGIYNLADSLPAASRILMEYACDALNKPYPPLIPFDQADLSSMALGFYQDNKKVNAKKITECGYKLRFKNYVEGLESIISC